MQTKRHIPRILAAALAAALLFTGCFGGGGSSSGSSESMDNSASSGMTGYAAGGTGMAVTAKVIAADPFEGEDGFGQTDVTVTAVVLDQEGRIASCVIDTAQLQLPFTEGGGLGFTEATQYPTKREMGTAYGLKEASSIGKEWYEQVDAFCAYVTGKTPEQVAGIAAPGGTPADPDLASGCTIDVSQYLEGVLMACENAMVLGSQPGDRLSLGIVSSAEGTAASAQQAGSARSLITCAAVTMDEEGRITGARLDEVETGFSLGADGIVTPPSGVTSKYAQGAGYMGSPMDGAALTGDTVMNDAMGNTSVADATLNEDSMAGRRRSGSTAGDAVMGTGGDLAADVNSGLMDGSTPGGTSAEGATATPHPMGVGDWHAQADSFARWLRGRTVEDIRELKLDEEGRPTDADLLTGTAMSVRNFVKAVTKACENANVSVN